MSSETLRFPIEEYSEELPVVLFTSYDARYSFNGTVNLENASAERIALYMPSSFAINDSLAYTDARAGFVGNFAQAGEDALASAWNNISQSEAESIRQTGSLDGAFSTLLGRGARGVAQGIIDALTPGANVASLVDRRRGRVLNPNAFTVFESPGLRSFSFAFKMIPKSEQEADSIYEIVKRFRSAAYPGVTGDGIEFTYPRVFSIRFIGGLGEDNEHIIKIPYVACESIGVTYNPNSMSFFKYKNSPSEVDITLSFKEVNQLTKEQINQGY